MKAVARPAVRSGMALLALLGGTSVARQQEAPTPEQEQTQGSLSELPLEELMQVEIVTPTKQPQKLEQAPAIVSVITREEIATWGYRSVAEALEHVPGFYIIRDFVTPNLGVRGLSSGHRAYNRTLKVLINGQPTTFRADGTNFLGLEFIPMRIIERIEVVRGPASALYGANAYLAVVNVITRQPSADHLGELTARVAYGPPTGVGGEVLLQHARQSWGALGAFRYGYVDRSGYELPVASPNYDTFATHESEGDLARPMSAFGAFDLEPSDKAALHLQVLYSRLDSFAEFLDFGTLSHDNHLVVDNFAGRAKLDLGPTDWLETSASAGFSTGGPSSRERLNAGSTETHPRRDFGYRAIDLVLESTARASRYSLLVGIDLTRDLEKPLTVFTVTNADGSETAPLGIQEEVLFQNLGVYGQGTAHPFESLPGLGLTANVRYDRHNIYGGVVNYHVGLAHAFTPQLTLKLRTGTSFLAPNPLYLYAQPLYAGDVVGNPELLPETAMTSEAQVLVTPYPKLLVSVNAYLTDTSDTIDLLPQGAQTVLPVNIGTSRTLGLETEARWSHGGHNVVATLQAQNTEEERDDPFLGTLSQPAAAYPRFLAELAWTWRSGFAGTVGLRGRYVGARRASRGNVLLANTPYLFDPYALVSAIWMYEWKHARVHLQVNNLLDSRYAEPGYNGVDLPGFGREATLGFTWTP
ncbi:TonB-dependent receptor plug domain-containing protein [Pyxidicoccus sp. MSG2]|uniref:TonB-dependent receptor plug domain-containing protein n=1 Tax=Pyxidicoccus sp. MSG2 TaxID=2996790 RepID=UPI00226D954C|nr:TonB-dependent receptor [Pyxidicoccus sp. MSG2]MCY1022920.1 TonB-dependent receptor [Pyxidicoccus sp. MSG2]